MDTQPSSPEALHTARSLARLTKVDGAFVVMRDFVSEPSAPMAALRKVASEAAEGSGVPAGAGYLLFSRDVTLLSGAIETAHAVVHETVEPTDYALHESGDALIIGFMQALQNETFDDTPQPDDEDRAIEIGNIYAFARWCGLTDEEVRLCYNTAFILAKQGGEWQS